MNIYPIRLCDWNHLAHIWHGDSEIATTTTDAGIWNSNYKLEYMFDGQPSSFWQSARSSQGLSKTITIHFHVSQLFIVRHKFVPKKISAVTKHNFRKLHFEHQTKCRN